MYLRLFAMPSIGLALAAYLSFWLSNAEQISLNAALRPVVETYVQGVAYFCMGLLILSALGFVRGGYRIWLWQKGETPFCPRCGSMMEIRNGRYGEFWGCMSYPRCRGSEGL